MIHYACCKESAFRLLLLLLWLLLVSENGIETKTGDLLGVFQGED